MSYRVYCDGLILHDSLLDDFKLIAPKLEIEVNKSGEFSFQIAHNHKYYDKIINKKSYIEIYEDGVWLWSGRPIKINTAMKLYKTITCEGELSFLHDSHQRIAEYHNISVKDYFTTLIENHNADVDEAKRFIVGNVTVNDPNDSLYRMSNYEDTFDSIQDKLINRLGGYLYIRHENNQRFIDYVTDYPHLTNQEIRFGSNIIDIALNESFENVATAIIPLGVKLSELNNEVETVDETSEPLENQRLTIESVNNGLDYIVDEDAVARFGLIKEVVTFDDVTLPTNLLSKGYEALMERVYSSLTISLSVFDRSYVEANLDKFKLGATIVVDTKKHGLSNDRMMISKMSISLVDVTKTKIETGISKRKLTDNVVQSGNSFDSKVENIVSDYVKNEELTVITPQLEELNSKIEQTTSNIMSEVSSKYLVVEEKEAIYKYVSSMVEQSTSDITMTFRNDLTNIENTVVLNQQNLEKYIRFSIDGIELGDVESPFKTNIDNTEIYFSQSGQKIAFISNSRLYILEAEFLNKITIGRADTGYYDIVVRNDKHWTLKYRRGGDN